MKKARYICFEGTEGVGKTTQCHLLAKRLTTLGYKVLLTKEPGTPLSALSMSLRGIMLDNAHDKELTTIARELISQSIRSIHLENVIYPALTQYDYIVQDRGMLSGLAYGVGCGNSENWINSLMTAVVGPSLNPYELYSDTIYLQGNVEKGLEKALLSKKEFTAGDAIEAKGSNFMKQVSHNMNRYSELFIGVKYLNVDDKNIQQVFDEILTALNIESN